MCRTCAIHLPLLPAQSIWLALRKGLQLLSSFLYTFLFRIWIDLAWELKLEDLSALFFLFLALFCQEFCFCFLGLSNFLEFIDSC